MADDNFVILRTYFGAALGWRPDSLMLLNMVVHTHVDSRSYCFCKGDGSGRGTRGDSWRITVSRITYLYSIIYSMVAPRRTRKYIRLFNEK